MKRAFQKGIYGLYECAECKRVRVFPHPTDEQTKAYYDWSFTAEYLTQDTVWFKVLVLPGCGLGNRPDAGGRRGKASRRGFRAEELSSGNNQRLGRSSSLTDFVMVAFLPFPRKG